MAIGSTQRVSPWPNWQADGRVLLLPVRHHSPACAWQVMAALRTMRPGAILVEGPSDASHLIPDLTSPEARLPLAIYCFRRDAKCDSAAWYPFCEYSPEYVALMTARELGAEAAFCDLPWWRRAEIEQDTGAPTTLARRTNSYADHRLRFSHVVEELCSRTGCRDFDELWDRLFEADGCQRAPERFWAEVATFCRTARETSDETDPARDGTRERERYMAQRIREALARHERVAVVLGGFHEVGIAELLASEAPGQTRDKPDASNHGSFLQVYGEEQLDRWSGYEAGMPAPAFYRWLWRTQRTGTEPGAAALDLMGRIAHHVRQRGEPISTAELIAAQEQLLGLARLRGEQCPTRETVRDAIRATWVKTATPETTDRLLGQVDAFLVGHRLGKVPSTADVPPIVRDFHEQVRRFRFPGPDGTGTRAERNIFLDLYTKPPHREKSAFLHQLVELDVRYALLESGPDFVRGDRLKRVREQWIARWHPKVDGQLIELAPWGATVVEAAAEHLSRRIQEADQCRAREAVAFFTSALVMGLSSLGDELANRIESSLLSEGDFASAAAALSGLIHLARYRPILGAANVPRLTAWIQMAYARAIWLLDTLPGLPDGAPERVDESLAGLARLRHATLVAHTSELDGERLVDGLERLRDRLGTKPLLEGAVVAVLRQARRIEETTVTEAILRAAGNRHSGAAAALGDFLRGLFTLSRHSMAHGTAVLDAVTACLRQYDNEEFLAALPDLRLAFTLFPPAEARRIADMVRARVGTRLPDVVLHSDGPTTAVDAAVGRFLDEYLPSASPRD